MSKMDLKSKLNQGLVRNEQQKFEAADKAMADGGLQPAFGLTPPPPDATGVSLAPVKTEKLTKPKKTKAPVRDSRATKKLPTGESSVVKETFSLPPDESARIDRVRMRAAALGMMLNRSEVIRLGVLAALNFLDDTQLVDAAEQIPRIKTGRPAG